MPARIRPMYRRGRARLATNPDDPDFSAPDTDANSWQGMDETYDQDWEDKMVERNDGSIWSSFEPSEDEAGAGAAATGAVSDDDGGGDAWLDTLASITADEIEFMNAEADRADKARQMQEWGFEAKTISSTLGVATDETLETDAENELLEAFKEETAESGFGMYLGEEIDPSEVESHALVERDEETGEPVRSQMVYVDEVTCIGCTNCATIAQSTFFMEDDYGRARVFQQWGDDDETIQIAIETCPVDCIHYIPYEELEKLEVERRGQVINFKARLVNQGEYGGDAQDRIGGGVRFSSPQRISGNNLSRCNNCPSRGCKNCPMYGVGDNPEFKKKEEERAKRKAKRKLFSFMKDEKRSADL